MSLTELALLLDDHPQRHSWSRTICAKQMDLTTRRPWRHPHIYHGHGITRLDGDAVYRRDADPVAVRWWNTLEPLSTGSWASRSELHIDIINLVIYAMKGSPID
jgi:hypothetical protein